MSVLFTAKARADLRAIGRYIARDNPVRAEAFIVELRDKALALADLPHAFALVVRYADRGIRCRPYGNYLIFYTTHDDDVVILHILHGARDVESMLL